MNVTAVIPNYNGARRLERLLPQLAGEVDVLVVDNGSTDESASVASAGGAQVIALGRNYGFAVAVNAGIRAATSAGSSSAWVAILNNDISLGGNFFRSLIAGAGSAWFAAPKILSASDPHKIDGSYDLPTRAGTAYRAGAGFADGPYFNDSRDIACAPMTAALFRRELFDKVGLLDEAFGSYLEDVDFGIRCALAGLHGRYVPSAVAYHEGSATLGGAWSPGATRWISRNQVLLARKYATALWPVVWGQALWGLLAMRHGVFGAWLAGKADGFRTPVSIQCRQDWLETVLDSERQIDALQRQNGWDWYWRQYFRLSPAAVANKQGGA